jgi:low temperature requirement protein LtrA
MATASEPTGVLRSPGQSQRVGFTELLFDVVFVFAFTQLAERLDNDLSWFGLYKGLVLLLAVWWIWYRMVWTTNRYDPDRPAIQLMVVVSMLASLFMSAALPHAFGRHDLGLVFGWIYVAAQTLRHIWLILLGGNRPAQLVSLRVLFWATLSAPLWIAGIYAPTVTARLTLWTAAVVLDYTGGILDFPTPRLGRAGLRGQKIAGEHIIERYRQVLVIAFGETILISGIQFTPYAFQRDHTAALLLSFTITVLLARIYIFRAGALLPQAIAATNAPAYIGELGSYAHMTMAAGVILLAVGDKTLIADPLGHPDTATTLVITGGAALFLVGRAALDYATFSRMSRTRPAAVAVLAATAPAAMHLPPMGVSAVTATVLLGLAITNWIAWRRNPRTPLPPPAPSGPRPH